MNNTILYIYGWGSNHTDSSTMKVVREIVAELGYQLVSIPYDQEHPQQGLSTLEQYITAHDIAYVIGHSLGGFMTLALDVEVKKIVLNPCMYPSREIARLNPQADQQFIRQYKTLENWLYDNSLPCLGLDEVMGLFGDHDELFSYYDLFSKIFRKAYMIPSSHRPTRESFSPAIQAKIKEFFS